MKYRIKGESVDIVDGPEAGRRFLRDHLYDTVPKGYEHLFTAVEEEAGEVVPAPPKKKAPKKKDAK